MAVPSTTQTFAPPFSDLLLDAFSRIQVRPSAITADHMFQARMSASLMLAEWATRDGPNLWKMEEYVIPLSQGVAVYGLSSTTDAILDYFIRLYPMNAATSPPVSISTLTGSTTVTVTQANHGLVPGAYVSFVIPIAVGGTTVYGTYKVDQVSNPNSYTVILGNPALSTVFNAGTVPIFTSTTGSSSVSVYFPYHGLTPGQQFEIQVITYVGGIPLASVYNVTAVTDINNFVIAAQLTAGANQMAAENGGLASIETQDLPGDPIDRIITPISRSDYAAQPDKKSQGFPTTVWFNRQAAPTLSLWPVPDQNGPYELHYWAMTQFDDIVIPGGVGVDVVWRFLKAFAAGLAVDLAMKFPPPSPNSIVILETSYEKAWSFAAKQDTENVPLYISPDLGSYYR